MKGVLKTIGLVFVAMLIVYVGAGLVFSVTNAAAADQPLSAQEAGFPIVEDSGQIPSGDGNSSTEVLPLPDALNNIGTGLERNEFTPDTYVAPTYDPFSNKYVEEKSFEELIPLSELAPNSPPTAKIKVRTAQSGLAGQNSGTTATEFIFDAYSSTDAETQNSLIKVRWDFDGDGTPETFFSRTKTTRHIFEKAGTYKVVLEVLDSGGLTSKAETTIEVVNNTSPYAYFTFSPVSSTEGHIFTFKTYHSYDSQYLDSALEYRFDWDGDGRWDTPYVSKNTWNHRYEDPGIFEVKMEVRDPEGLTDIANATVIITTNEPPVARISIEAKPIQQIAGEPLMRYYFDASASTDPEGQKLQYRWDYNYTGKDDINFDTYFTYGSQSNGYYAIPGKKTVRLQVRDEVGAIGEAFVTIEVE